MKTDDLIRALAVDTRPAAPTSALVLRGLVPALLTGLVLLLATLGPRADLGAVLHDPVSMMRFVLGLALGGLALRAMLQLARPGAGAAGLRAVAGVALVAAGLWLWAWLKTPPELRLMALVGKTMVACLVTIPLLSILPVTALLYALRNAAPTRPRMAGLAAGLAGGGFAAAVYATHCTEDSPVFFVTWYGLAIVLVTLTSAAIGQRVLRW